MLEREDDQKRNIARWDARADTARRQQIFDFVQAETVKFASIIEKEGLQMEAEVRR